MATKTSHRRCQYQGEGCSGIAHAGHDQCAHCYFQYVKPALMAERQEVKRRRQIKRQQLTSANRALISEVDLKEPQMRDQVNDAVRQVAPPGWIPPVVKEHVYALAETLTDIEDSMGEEVAMEVSKDIGRFVQSGALEALAEPAELPKPLQRMPVKGTGTGRKGKPPITDDIRQEIGIAYEAGEPVLTIARRYDVARGTVLNIVTELGVTRPASKPVILEEEPAVPTNAPRAVVTANGIAGAVGTWKVTYTVSRTETVEIKADSLTSAARAAQFNLPEGSEVQSLERVS